VLIFVIVPTYRRPLDLARCLAALAAQKRLPDRTVLVVRSCDKESLGTIAAWRNRLPIEIAEVAAPGVVQAMNAGLARCRSDGKCDVVALVDDDAAPRSDWLERIEAMFNSDLRVGAIGGRDWVHQNGRVETGCRSDVGLVRWYGRIVGNHHLGIGPVRSVDILKGVNCAFRMAAIGPVGFDTRLRGKGAQVHWELCVCFAIKRAGWQILYDAAIGVDHFPAQRFDRDKRDHFDPVATADRTYNLRLALESVIPGWKRMAAFMWLYLIGTNDEPGFVIFFRMLMRREPYAIRKFCSAHGIGGRRR